MSYFAVLSDTQNAVEVNRCHVNLWVLGGLFGRSIFYFDVGLGLCLKAPCEKLSLALPMGVDCGDFWDLREKTEASANLIFGEPAIVRGHTLELGDEGEKQTLHLSGLQARRIEECSGIDHSVWELQPRNWSQDGETYVRCRFRVSSFRRNWLPQQSGALVDLRVCDVRESARVPNLSGLDDRIVPIRELNLFAIIPTSLKCRAVSPQPRHVRMLEGEAWSAYLDRRRKSLSKRKLTVYYWKWKDEKRIDRRNPFRAFLDLAEERAVLGPRTYLVFMLLAFCIAYGQDLVQLAAPLVHRLVASLLAWVAAAGLIGIALLAWNIGPGLMDLFRRVQSIRSLVRKIEDRLYGDP